MIPAAALSASLLLLAGAATPAEREPPICVGFTLIAFESGSTRLSEPSEGMLNAFVRILEMSEFPSRVEVSARTDSLGSQSANLRLARRRAERVRAFLVARGVARDRIELEALGEAQQMVQTPDGTPEKQNRVAHIIERLHPDEDKRRTAWWAKHGRPTIVC